MNRGNAIIPPLKTTAIVNIAMIAPPKKLFGRKIHLDHLAAENQDSPCPVAPIGASGSK
jgi:hypothetical protein